MLNLLNVILELSFQSIGTNFATQDYDNVDEGVINTAIQKFIDDVNNYTKSVK